MGIKLIADRDGDNLAAVDLAIELMTLGEASASKEFHSRDEGTLLVEGIYRTPLQATRRAKAKQVISATAMREIIESAMGRRPFD